MSAPNLTSVMGADCAPFLIVYLATRVCRVNIAPF